MRFSAVAILPSLLLVAVFAATPAFSSDQAQVPNETPRTNTADPNPTAANTPRRQVPKLHSTDPGSPTRTHKSLTFPSASASASEDPDSSAKVHGSDANSQPPQSFFKNDVSTASYGVGFNFGDKLRTQQFLQVDYDAMIMGIKDAISGSDSRVGAKELYDVFVTLQKDAAEEYRAIGARNLEISKSFMIQNEQKRDLVKTPSGLQYQIIAPGEGESPKFGDSIQVHYIGKLIDGRVFDDTKEREEPAVISLDNVIKGWQEALPMMKKGARWTLYVPPELGYGMETPIEEIPPNAVLIFDIELLDVNPQN